MHALKISRISWIDLSLCGAIMICEDGDLRIGLRVGVVNVLGYIFLLRAQIALKPSEIESMGSCGSILMSKQKVRAV